MKITPQSFTKLLTLLFSIIILINCSKDTDLFADNVLEDSNNPQFGEFGSGETSDDSEATNPGEEELVDLTFSFNPINDAYIENDQGFNQSLMKLEENRRMSYIMFDLAPVNGEIQSVELEFTVEGDEGNGTINIYKGLSSNWNEETLDENNAPALGMVLGSVTKTYALGSTETVQLESSAFSSEKTTLVLIHSQGNDLALASKENGNSKGPKLRVNFRGPNNNNGNQQEQTQEDPAEEETTPPPADDYFVDCTYGGDCMTPNTSCMDSNFPIIEEWVKAGVVGGIPSSLTVVETIGPSDNLQSTINNVSSNGGGVILLRTGTYPITQTLNMRSNVVLRGEDKDNVILESTIRNTRNFNNGSIYFDDGVTRAGLENLTYYYRVDGCEPIDDISGAAPQFSVVHSNDPCGRSDLRTAGIVMWREAHNNWIDNCNILESGSHPVRIWGDHNTVRNTFVNRTYNKGGSGVGYFYISGDYNLIVNNIIQRLRHVAVDGYGGTASPKYNVLYNNIFFRVDVNFHEYDGGYNLVERNEISPEPYHHLQGKPILTGHQPSGHGLPGPINYFYNNDTSRAGIPVNGEPGVIYTFEPGVYQSVIETGLPEPSCGTFYPMTGN